MPIGQAPGGEPNITKPLSEENFLKLKVGDKFWIIPNEPLPGEMRDVVGPIIIEYTCFKERSVSPYATIKVPKVGLLVSIVAKFVQSNKVFLSEQDARKEIKKEARLN